MDSKSPKRLPTPGKRVQRQRDDNGGEAPPPKKRTMISSDTLERDYNLVTVKELKTLPFSTHDYPNKFFARVLCIVPPRENKSPDVHYHRRALVLADHTDYIKGFLRHNNDDMLKLGHSYYFSKFKLYAQTELLLHENSIMFE